MDPFPVPAASAVDQIVGAEATDHDALTDADRATAQELARLFSRVCALLRETGGLADHAHILAAQPDALPGAIIRIYSRALDDFLCVAAELADSFDLKGWSGDEDDE